MNQESEEEISYAFKTMKNSYALKTMKNSRAPGEEGIVIETIAIRGLKKPLLSMCLPNAAISPKQNNSVSSLTQKMKENSQTKHQ